MVHVTHINVTCHKYESNTGILWACEDYLRCALVWGVCTCWLHTLAPISVPQPFQCPPLYKYLLPTPAHWNESNIGMSFKSSPASLCPSVSFRHTCDSLRWKLSIPEVKQIEKLRLLGISQYKFKLRFWLNLNSHREIWNSWFGGFQWCSIFSGNRHMNLAHDVKSLM